MVYCTVFIYLLFTGGVSSSDCVVDVAKLWLVSHMQLF